MTTAVSFEQFCPIAISLEALGDRWSLLLLRDLLWAGPQSRAGLLERNPGLDEDALTERVTHLVRHGLLDQLDEPKARYALSERGEGVSEVITALFNFGMPMLDDVVVNDWMLAYAVADAARRAGLDLLDVEERVILSVTVDEGHALVEISPGLMRIVEDHEPHATIVTVGSCLAAVVSGKRTIDDLIDSGDARITGDEDAARVFLATLPAH